jgi:hypothetical protein
MWALLMCCYRDGCLRVVASSAVSSCCPKPPSGLTFALCSEGKSVRMPCTSHQRSEAVCTDELREGNSQLLEDPEQVVGLRIGCRLVCCLHGHTQAAFTGAIDAIAAAVRPRSAEGSR